MSEAAVPIRRHSRRFLGTRAVIALMLREMTTSYGRSVGGYFWAIAEPVAAIAMLSLAFSFFVRNPPLGESFPLFYASGFLPIATYTTISNNIAQSIRFSRALLAYPRVTYIDAIVARLSLAILTQLLVTLLVIGGAIAMQHAQINIDYVVLFRAMAMVVALGTAVGLLNCHLMTRFPVWQSIWGILNRPVVLVSGLLFLVDELPEDLRNIVLLLPHAHFISMFRRGIYDTYDARYVSEPYVYGISLVIGGLGMLLLHRYHRELLSEK